VALGAGPLGAYEEVQVRDGGAVAGTVRFTGVRPRLEALAVTRNADLCGERVVDEVLAVGAGGGVRDTVVLVEGVRRGRKGGGELVLDHRGCRFVPRVAATVAGARVRARNSDPVLHAAHGVSGARRVFHLALPAQGQMVDITRRLTGPGVVRIRCAAHPHMIAWLVVHDSPYVAVTDDAGAYRIPDLPPGTYRVTMWHEGFRPRGRDRDGGPQYDAPRTVSREVRVAPGATARADFELK
jgi:hypothetical protein